MKESRLIKAMIIGATAGVLASLADRKTREQVKRGTEKVSRTTGHFLKNPSEGVHQLRVGWEQAANLVYESSEKASRFLSRMEKMGSDKKGNAE